MDVVNVYYKGQYLTLMECDKKIYKGYNYMGFDIIVGKYDTYEYDYYTNKVRFIVTNRKENNIFIEKYDNFLDNWLRIEKKKLKK